MKTTTGEQIRIVEGAERLRVLLGFWALRLLKSGRLVSFYGFNVENKPHIENGAVIEITMLTPGRKEYARVTSSVRTSGTVPFLLHDSPKVLANAERSEYSISEYRIQWFGGKGSRL